MKQDVQEGEKVILFYFLAWPIILQAIPRQSSKQLGTTSFIRREQINNYKAMQCQNVIIYNINKKTINSDNYELQLSHFPKKKRKRKKKTTQISGITKEYI